MYALLLPGFTSQMNTNIYNTTRVLKCNTCSKTAGDPNNTLFIITKKDLYFYFKVQFHTGNYFKITVSFIKLGKTSQRPK